MTLTDVAEEFCAPILPSPYSASQTDVREWLPKSAAPCLYMQATYDRSVPESTLSYFTETVPNLKGKEEGRGSSFYFLGAASSLFKCDLKFC